ncbi:unnamed protein product [Closterium sp. NIES-54]
MQREARGRDDEYGSGMDARERGDGIGVGRNGRGQIGERSGRVSQVGVEGVEFESYTIGAPPLRQLATNPHPVGSPVISRSHPFGDNIVPPREPLFQMGAVPAGSMGRTGHGLQSSGIMQRDHVDVVEHRSCGQDGGTQRTVQLPRLSTVPTLFYLSPREYTEEDKDKVVGIVVEKAFNTTQFDCTNIREWALRKGFGGKDVSHEVVEQFENGERASLAFTTSDGASDETAAISTARGRTRGRGGKKGGKGGGGGSGGGGGGGSGGSSASSGGGTEGGTGPARPVGWFTAQQRQQSQQQ